MTQFTAGLVQLVVSSSQAQFQTAKIDDETLTARDSAVAKLLKKLPETPMRGIGFNYGYDIAEGSGAIDPLFLFPDAENIEAVGGKVVGMNVTRKIAFGERRINLILARTKAGVRIDFNYHHDTAIAADAIPFLEANSLTSKANSLDLADKLYGLKVEQ